MYLKHLTIRNFKTIQNLDLDIGRNLNVIFGPNEVGKSTVLEALTAVFFVNADSTKAEVLKYRSWESQADPFVHVTFMSAGQECELEKIFVGAKKGRLRCTASGLDTPNKDRIKEELGKLIPLYTEDGTSLKNTFWMAQRELEETVSSLKDDADIRATLRETIFKSDGDIEAVKLAVDSKISEIGKGWQHIAKNPGPLAQAKKEVDRLTGEVYDLRAKLAALDRDILRYKDLTAKVASLETKIKEDDLVLTAVEKYKQAKGNLDTARANFTVLLEAIENHEHDIANATEFKKKSEELSGQKKEVQEIIAAIQRYDQRTHTEVQLNAERELLKSLQNLDNQIAEIKTSLGETKLISKADLESARSLDHEVESKREALVAAQLSVVAKALSDIPMTISGDEDHEHIEKLKRGEEKTFRADHKIVLKVPEIVELTVSSGLSGTGDLKKELEIKDASLRSFLANHGMKTVREIAERYDEQQQQLGRINALETEKKGTLRARTTEDIQTSIDSLSAQSRALADQSTYSLKPGESLDTWQQKRDQLTRESADVSAEVKQLDAAVKRFQETYVSLESAGKRKRDLALDVAKTEAVLEAIDKMELPDDQILLRKRQLEANKTEHDKQHTELLKLSGALQVAPVSSDQVRLKEAELADAKSRYDSEILEYEAYNVLAETLAEAEIELSKHLMQPVEEIATIILPRVTAGRYSMISLNENLEVETLRYGKLDVDPSDLSIGAKGQLALVLRLALIDFLGGKERQMVVIDDALVNFDQARLKEGKQILSEFAQKHQVIYLSCHPEIESWEGAKIHRL